MAQFAWLDWLFNSVWVSVNDDGTGLTVRSLQQPDRLLLPLGNSLFRQSDRRMASHVFFGGQNSVLSNGLTTWQRSSLVKLALGWLSLALGALGLLCILVRGTWLLMRGRAAAKRALLAPWACLVALALPLLLYSQQSFLRFGELTAASALLAGLTAALPLCLCIALPGLARSAGAGRLDLAAAIASLQLCLVLLLAGVLPVVFWR